MDQLDVSDEAWSRKERWLTRLHDLHLRRVLCAVGSCLAAARLAIRVRRGRRSFEVGICPAHERQRRRGDLKLPKGWRVSTTARALKKGEILHEGDNP